MSAIEIDEEKTETRTTRARGGAPKPPPAPVRIMRELEVELTDKEKLTRNVELLEAMEHRDQLRALKSQETADRNAEIKMAEKNVKERASALRSGKEKRPVECIERQIFSQNCVEVVRSDTGAVVEKRAMTLEEREIQLPFSTVPKSGEPLTASIAESLDAKDPGAGVRGVIEAREDGKCGAEIDGRVCDLDSGHSGSHVLSEAREPEGDVEIDDPSAVLDAAGMAETPAAKKRGRPAGSKNTPKATEN
jgi:hypothetical protein